MDTSAYAALGLVAPPHRTAIPVGPQDIAHILDAPRTEIPDATALVDPNRSYSYAELDGAVCAAGDFLAKRGISAGDRVAASLPNCCDLVIAFLAAQRIGAVWVGINGILPAVDKEFILVHSGARFLLADDAATAQVEPLRDRLPALETLETAAPDSAWTAAIEGDTPATEPADVDPFAPAAIMYTSGTTGTPKGVVHSQHNMMTVCAAFSSAGLLSPTARRGAVLPMTITNVMILGPLMAFWNKTSFVCGSTAKTVPMVEWLRREHIGTISAVPTMIYDILQADVDLPDELRLGSGGAPLPEPVRQAFARRYGYNLLQSYGLTEAPTVVAESHGEDVPEGASGKAASHLNVTIRDKSGAPCPTGEIGEICIAATTTGSWADVYTPALGYWNDLEKSEALLAGGVMHTGDFGKFDPEGWLHIADRGSELILRGGSNVYPAEVERVLHMHAQVADCALVGKPDARLGNKSVAFVQPVLEADRAVLVEELGELCRERLARYKIPDEWIIVDQFPRNAMGKVVKSKLRERLAMEATE